MSADHPTPTRAAYTASSPARKLWAVACTVGVACFLTFGYLALSGATGDRPNPAMNYVLALAGLGLGVVGWFRVMSYAPRMHGRRAAARERMEEEYKRKAD